MAVALPPQPHTQPQTRRSAFARYQRDMGLFSRDVIGVPLFAYQRTWADYVLELVRTQRTETVVIEMPRQSGKNETSAQLEVALLATLAQRGGEIVKTAPTYKPQIINSRARFDNRAAQAAERLPFLRFKPKAGYQVWCKRAGISFLSTDPKANVVGATASMMLEVDEAQDTDKATFNRKFSPMRASTGAPLVAYGTTWTDDTLLEDLKRGIEEGRTRGRVFRVLPELVGESNPRYWDFVESEIQRLGSRDHPFIKTQYFLEQLPTAGRILQRQHLELMAGDHERRSKREAEPQIVAGLDFAGADEDAQEMVSLGTTSTRDSVALTIGAVDHVAIGDGLVVPHVRILARYEWVNVHPTTLHSALYRILWQEWRVDLAHCDATGIGATGTAFLQKAIDKPGRQRIHAVTFDGAWTTSTNLAFRYLATVMGGRLVDYQVPFDPIATAGAESPDTADPDRHAWWQRGHAKLQGKTNQRVRMHVPESEGHDDLLTAEQLMVDAAYEVGPPRQMRSGSVNFYGSR